jgi:hypothetical protein
VKLCEDEEGDWYSSQLLCVQSEEYTTLHGALEGYGIHSVDEVLYQHLIRPQKRKMQITEQNSWMH